jgi:hypothetical protein
MKGPNHTLSIDGTRLLMGGKPFPLQGLSFFNAIYNPAFNAGRAAKRHWLRKFQANGINLIRIWGQWDFPIEHPYVDVAPDHTLYSEAGNVREEMYARLDDTLALAGSLGIAVEVTLFSQEREYYLPIKAMERAAREMSRLLRPHRHVILQIWNEESYQIERLFDAAKSEDSARLVTNSHAGSNYLGDEKHNRLMDLLTPHTIRRGIRKFWLGAAKQVAELIATFGKPVIDDEPARCGLLAHGGIEGGTQARQHIEQCRLVREVGGYHLYHHDMFQRTYGYHATPPSGIPDPDFSPFHRQVFDYLRDNRKS